MAHFDPDRFKRGYISVAVICANTLLLFGLLNLLAYVGMKWFFNGKERKDYRRMLELVNRQAYTDASLNIRRTDTYIDSIVWDHYSAGRRGISYYPMAEYIEPVYHSNLSSIDTTDILIPHRYSWEATEKGIGADALYVFAFGGSTTMGTFVANDDTWPSALARLANKNFKQRVRIVNLGYPAYSPTQETSLFLSLLKAGYRPSVAIFMDGVNTGPMADNCEYSSTIANGFKRMQHKHSFLSRLADAMPVVVLASVLTGRDRTDMLTDGNIVMNPLVEQAADAQTVQMLAERFVQNFELRELIGQYYGIPVIQILQPNGLIGYNPQFLSDGMRAKQRQEHARGVDSAFSNLYGTILAKADYLDLSGLLHKFGKPALSDDIHYGPAFNHYLAYHIYPLIPWDSLQPYRIAKGEETGYVFDAAK